MIANLEVGRLGTVGVAELLILAAALDVPPTMLITAVGLDERVDILPHTRGHIQSEGYKLPEVPRSLAAMLRESDSSGRRHRQEADIPHRDKEESEEEKPLPPVIYDLLMHAMHDEPRQEASGGGGWGSDGQRAERLSGHPARRLDRVA